MSSSAINTQVAQLKIGNVQNQADNSAVYSGGIWSLKNSTALTSVTITDAGNVGVGVTPSAWSPSAKAIELGVRGSLFFESTGGNFFGIANNSYYDGTNYRYKQTAAAAQLNLGNDGSFNFLRAASGTAGNAITYTESMRIDASGNLLVGTTSSQARAVIWDAGGSNPTVRVFKNAASTLANPCLTLDKYDNNTTTSQVFAQFTVNNQGTASGQINANGANQVAFGSWSDERLKENIADLQPQLANILALRPVEFDYIESEGGGHQIGFVAQEMQQVYADAIGERADGMLSISGWDKTTARLVKAIQELSAKVDAQAAEIEALKAE